MRFITISLCIWSFVLIGNDDMTDDPYIWLEEISSERSLNWVVEKSRETLGALKKDQAFDELLGRIEKTLDSSDRIPAPRTIGDAVYNFWQDADHPRGVLRRTSMDEFLKETPKWETVLDIDALAKTEGENWVYKDFTTLRPSHDRALMMLSRGGADATVIREYDLKAKQFVEDGFKIEEAKTTVAWKDRDHVYVGTDFGDGSMTDSGYPRLAKLWKRGTPLTEAKLIFEGKKTDVGVFAVTVQTHDGQLDVLIQSDTFFTQTSYLIQEGELKRVDLPEDADSGKIFRGQLLVELKSDWKLESKTYPQGSLIAIDLNRFMEGSRDFQILVEPSPRRAISGITTTKSYLLVTLLENVTSQLLRYEFKDGKWTQQPIEVGDMGSFGVVDSSLENDTCFLQFTNFLVPPSLMKLDCASAKVTTVKSEPGFFDATPYVAEQAFAKSKDGTEIPYFIVRSKDMAFDGKNPTLLYGYGGFEVSLRPAYSATIGMGWLEHGGVYVLANIRGGGEFGPKWHQAALKKNRHKAYEDFIAVAEDLIERNVTAPAHLGIQGGSNGGLLVGATFTMRPDLFNAVVCQVPLLDMRRFHKLLAGASWMAEYGDPEDADMWSYIKTYSPYHNLDKDRDYPTPLFMTSTRDDRVHPGHARKMVAKMADLGHQVYYYENTEGGHAGAANNRQRAFMSTLGYVYLQRQLKDKPKLN